MSKSEQGDNSVNIYRILPNVNQVIYTLDTICEPDPIDCWPDMPDLPLLGNLADIPYLKDQSLPH